MTSVAPGLDRLVSSKKCGIAGCTSWAFANGVCKAHGTPAAAAPSTASSGSTAAVTITTGPCHECDIAIGSVSCTYCRVRLCSSCDTKLHSRALRDHRRLPITVTAAATNGTAPSPAVPSPIRTASMNGTAPSSTGARSSPTAPPPNLLRGASTMKREPRSSGPQPIIPGGESMLLPTAPGRWIVGRTTEIGHLYAMGKQMGQPGAYGSAHQVKHLKSGQIRAAKVIRKARFGVEHYPTLRQEIDIMARLDHPNIIKLFDVFETPNELYIIMELCLGGELFDRIKATGTYSEKAASGVLRQLFAGVQYLHSKGIAHCDLKPDNFLFLNTAEDSPLKIIDFGMSKFVKRRQHHEVICGTPFYVAPEVIEGRYKEHCDLWSLGVIMFVMLFGYPPFYANEDEHGSMTDQVIFSLIRRGFEPRTKPGFGAHFPVEPDCSESAKDLISRLILLDVAKRWTATEALEHSWLVGLTASESPLAERVLNSLKTFSGSTKFKDAVLGMMTDYMTPDDIKTLKQIFLEYDVNHDGQITLTELKTGLSKLGTGELKGMSERDLLALMSSADVDGDGALSYKELLNTVLNRKLAAKEERLWEAFCKFDLDGDGRVTLDEIAAALGDHQEAKLLLGEVDRDGDGTVSYDEFMTIWEKREADRDGIVESVTSILPPAAAAAT